jgi:hypothetical protein
LRQFYVTTHMKLESLNAVVADDKPEFKGAESAAQGYLPIAVINHGARLRCLVAQVFRQNAQTLDE